MIDSELHSLDEYETILNNIPSLWAKALTDFRFVDLDDKTVFDLLRGKRTLKNGTDKLLTKSSYKRYICSFRHFSILARFKSLELPLIQSSLHRFSSSKNWLY